MGEGEVVLLLYKKLLLSGIIVFSQRNDIQMLVYRLVLADADEDCRKRRIERWLLLKNVAIMFIYSTADANNNNQVKSRDDFSSRLSQKGQSEKVIF